MTRNRQSSPQAQTLLGVLMDRPRAWHYGYELSKQTQLKSGTLYPLLMRLADHGMLDADWREPEREGRPPRHVYRLTSKGLAWARQQLQAERLSVLAAARPSKASA